MFTAAKSQKAFAVGASGGKILLAARGSHTTDFAMTHRSGHQRSRHKAFASNHDHQKQIAIVGGGLGGLMAARVLQKHGLNPVVFERESSKEARGQGGQLDLHPKSGRLLRKRTLLTALTA